MDVSDLSPIERAILAFFSQHDVVLNPSSLAANIDYDQNYTARQCNELSRHGLLEKLDGPKYRLTDEGRRLAEEIEEEELEEDGGE